MPGQQAQCEITFDLPYDLSVYFGGKVFGELIAPQALGYSCITSSPISAFAAQTAEFLMMLR